MAELRRPREEDSYPALILHLQRVLPKCRLWTHGRKFRDEHGVWRNAALCEGMADIVGVCSGFWLEIEVKTRRGKQEDTQRLHQVVVERCGGIYVLARSPEEAERAIRAELAKRGIS